MRLPILHLRLMMSAGRRILEAERFVRDGKWQTWGPMLLLGIEMKGTTLGLVGFGRIGKAMARRAAGFDMRVIYYDPNETKPDPDIKANRVDFELCSKSRISSRCIRR